MKYYRVVAKTELVHNLGILLIASTEGAGVSHDKKIFTEHHLMYQVHPILDHSPGSQSFEEQPKLHMLNNANCTLM